MNKVTRSLCTISLVSIAAACSNMSMALPIGFVDQGSTTLDQNSGLEWLDVAKTLGRSFLDVKAEIDSGTGLGANQWRFATHTEFESMANNFFEIAVLVSPYILCIAAEDGGQNAWFDECGEGLSSPVTTAPFESFISLFGEIGSSSVRGFLDARSDFDATIPPYYEVYSDNAYVGVGDGVYFTGEISTNYADFDVCDSNIYSIEECMQNAFSFSSAHHGSFLVRESSVSEPSAFILLALGIAGLGIRRRKLPYIQ